MGLLSWWRGLRWRRYAKSLRVIPPRQIYDDDSFAPTQVVSLHEGSARDLQRTKVAPLVRGPTAPLPDNDDGGLGLLDQLTTAAPLGYTKFAGESGRKPDRNTDFEPTQHFDTEHHLDHAHDPEIVDAGVDPDDDDGGSHGSTS